MKKNLLFLGGAVCCFAVGFIYFALMTVEERQVTFGPMGIYILATMLGAWFLYEAGDPNIYGLGTGCKVIRHLHGSPERGWLGNYRLWCQHHIDQLIPGYKVRPAYWILLEDDHGHRGWVSSPMDVRSLYARGDTYRPLSHAR